METENILIGGLIAIVLAIIFTVFSHGIVQVRAMERVIGDGADPIAARCAFSGSNLQVCTLYVSQQGQ
jgi:hypothetical protein